MNNRFLGRLCRVAAGVVVVASGTAMAGSPMSDAASSGVPALSSEVVVCGLFKPNFVAHAPGDASRLFVVQQDGVIRVIEDGVLVPEPFLDISDLIPTETYNGMVGLAFHPDYAMNGFFYVHHPIGNGPSHTLTIVRYQVTGDPNVADPLSRSMVRSLPYPNMPGHHLGGWLGFGPDGYLYIPLGDGGTTGDSNAGARVQSLTSPWGKVLRVDVDGDDYPFDDDRNYSNPPDNPFVGVAGDDDIWAFGLRQPYRCCFDRANGDFYIADVGLFAKEEINIQPGASAGGENYGWNCAEGTNCSSNGNCHCVNDDLTFPVHEYTHSSGCSITGGNVYRGCAIPELDGTYFYGDWCSARIWSFRYEGGSVVDVTERTDELNPDGQPAISQIVGFGEDAMGEVYICSQNGCVYRIIPEGGIVDKNGNGIADSCESKSIPGDLDGDGSVNVEDLLTLLGAWGPCGEPCPPSCVADIVENCAVDVEDLLALLANWG